MVVFINKKSNNIKQKPSNRLYIKQITQLFYIFHPYTFSAKVPYPLLKLHSYIYLYVKTYSFYNAVYTAFGSARIHLPRFSNLWRYRTWRSYVKLFLTFIRRSCVLFCWFYGYNGRITSIYYSAWNMRIASHLTVVV